MGEGHSEASNLLHELVAMPLSQRIEAIAKDVFQNEDRFLEIEGHDLAKALGVADAWRPGGGWSFLRYARKTSVEEYAECNFPVSEIIYLIQDEVPTDRFNALLQNSSYLDDVKNPSFAFLTADERDLLETAIAKKELSSASESGMNCLAHFNVKTASGHELQFEGVIEDDGACLGLKTPYDFRDGNFANLDNCLTDSW
jgi:hypothetical protein